MKRNVIALFCVALLAVGLISCEPETPGGIPNGESPEVQPVLHFDADLEVCYDRLAGSDMLSADQLHFDSGMQMKVFGSANAEAVYNVTPRGNCQTADVAWAEGGQFVGPYKAIYPATIAVDDHTVTLPEEQESVRGLMTKVPMYAETGTDTLSMNLLVGVLRVRLMPCNSMIQNITLAAESPLWGRFAVDNTSGAPALNYLRNGGNEVRMRLAELPSLANGHDIYFYLPAGNYGNITITLVDERGFQCVRNITDGLVIERGRYSEVALSGLEFLRPEVEGDLPGVFQVAQNRYVRFAKGNLQYHATGGNHLVVGGQTMSGVWRFAPTQYSVIGNDNTHISSSYNGWIDLFGWGTSGINRKFPYSTSRTDLDYGNGLNNISGTNYDWGVMNAISNGGNLPGLWRTLTGAEWEYLIFRNRKGLAKVNNVNGLMILPSNFSMPGGLTFHETTFAGNDTLYTANVYTGDAWQSMEDAGALFLPAAGCRYGTDVALVNRAGFYWSATSDSDASRAMNMFWYPFEYCLGVGNRSYGRSVRLCYDVEP